MSKKQVHGVMTYNSDGASGINLQYPIAGNDKNVVSAIGAAGLDKNHKVTSRTAGMTLENINGHGVTVTKTQMPGVGDQVAAAGTFNLIHKGNHNLDATAFASRTALKNPAVPSFNTVGGGVDYMFKKKVGVGLQVAHTPLFKQTDYSATGNVNLLRGRNTSLDFNAGMSKSVSPYIPRSSWEPKAGFSLKKSF